MTFFQKFTFRWTLSQLQQTIFIQKAMLFNFTPHVGPKPLTWSKIKITWDSSWVAEMAKIALVLWTCYVLFHAQWALVLLNNATGQSVLQWFLNLLVEKIHSIVKYLQLDLSGIQLLFSFGICDFDTEPVWCMHAPSKIWGHLSLLCRPYNDGSS